MKKRKTLSLILILCLSYLCACGLTTPSETAPSETASETAPVFQTALPGEYDSVDTCVLVNKDESKSTVSFYNYELEKTYTLTYDSITKFYDKYGTAVSLGQLKIGTLSDIKFLKSGKLLTELKINSSAFVISDITGFSIDTSAKVFSYKEDSYKITSGTALLSKDAHITLKDLEPIDKVTITGIDTDIYCVLVEEGHGYVLVSGQSELLGGFLEFGSLWIEEITKNMRIPLVEGDYEVKVSKDEILDTKKISVKAYEETVLDLSEVELPAIKTGKVLFAVNPEEAKVFIDGEEIDTSKLIELEYGSHKLSATLKDYESLTRYFNVGEESAILDVILEKIPGTEEEKEDEVDSSNTEGYFVFITGPSDVEVTIDGNYIGLSPVSVEKKAGTHTIYLRKNGYKARTYTILVENTSKDSYYSFEELEKDSSVSSQESAEEP